MQITDTLKAAKELQQAGFPSSQAEALAQQQERAAEELIANIRAAFAPEFAAIRAEMNGLKTGLQGEFREALRDQLFKFTVMLFSGLGLTIAALSLIYALFRN